MDESLGERRRLDRRGFLRGAAGAVAGAGVASTLGGGAVALAHGDGHHLRPLPSPEPIPGGSDLSGFGLLPPYDFIHIFAPGPDGVVLPFTGVALEGLDVEPSSLTDFHGKTAMAYHVGSAVGNDGKAYNLETDLRAYEGHYVDADGSTHWGTFAFI